MRFDDLWGRWGDEDDDEDDDGDDDYVPRELTYNCAFIKGTPGYIFPPLQCWPLQQYHNINQGLKILLMSGVTVTSASQILE